MSGLAHKAIGEGRHGRAMRIALRELPRDSAATGALGWDNPAVRGLEAKLAGAAMLSNQLVEMHHEAKVYTASFSPDGRRIASASADATARLWDSATGREVAARRSRFVQRRWSQDPYNLCRRHRPHLGCADLCRARNLARA